jgi:hypothetical protein
MKLYATTTSERASKGQGGNEFINIDLLIGDAKNPIDAGRISMKTTGEVYWIEYFSPHILGDSIKRVELFNFEKGKRQKGEKGCPYCGEYPCSEHARD